MSLLIETKQVIPLTENQANYFSQLIARGFKNV